MKNFIPYIQPNIFYAPSPKAQLQLMAISVRIIKICNLTTSHLSPSTGPQLLPGLPPRPSHRRDPGAPGPLQDGPWPCLNAGGQGAVCRAGGCGHFCLGPTGHVSTGLCCHVYSLHRSISTQVEESLSLSHTRCHWDKHASWDICGQMCDEWICLWLWSRWCV